MNRNITILIAEPSEIIFEGLSSILNKSSFTPSIQWVPGLKEMQQIYLHHQIGLIIVNPSLIQHSPKEYRSLKEKFGNIRWVGLVYAFYDQQTLEEFDALISVSESSEKITNTISSLLLKKKSKDNDQLQDVLSDREIEVLKLLTTGNINKEIADKLNISIHTVITHRKNISHKTGIKSVSGLTIYAVLKKFISLDNLPE